MTADPPCEKKNNNNKIRSFSLSIQSTISRNTRPAKSFSKNKTS